MTGHTQSGLFAARPPGRRSGAAVATSALVHVVMLGVLAALARVAPAPAPPGEHRPLTFVMTTPLSVPHEPRPGLRLPAPVVERGEPERRAPVDVAMPGPPPPAPKPVAHAEPAPAPAEPPVQARPILAPHLVPTRMPPPVTVGLFADSAPTVPEIQPVKTVRDSGFDSASPAARPGDTKSAAVVGAFDASPATGPGRMARPDAAIASAGFGSSRADGAVTRQVTDVRPGGFDAARPAPAPPARATLPPERIDIPVEILFKPLPIYTEEARRLKLEGDVLLDVEFVSTGVVSVRQVVRGLGHGLDESAATAARQIRFKPALSAGRPISFRTTVHIVFRLA